MAPHEEEYNLLRPALHDLTSASFHGSSVKSHQQQGCVGVSSGRCKTVARRDPLSRRAREMVRQPAPDTPAWPRLFRPAQDSVGPVSGKDLMRRARGKGTLNLRRHLSPPGDPQGGVGVLLPRRQSALHPSWCGAFLFSASTTAHRPAPWVFPQPRGGVATDAAGPLRMVL